MKPSTVVLLGLGGLAFYLAARSARAQSPARASLARRTVYGGGYADADLPPELAALDEPMRTEAGNAYYSHDLEAMAAEAARLREAGYEAAAARIDLRASLVGASTSGRGTVGSR